MYFPGIFDEFVNKFSQQGKKITVTNFETIRVIGLQKMQFFCYPFQIDILVETKKRISRYLSNYSFYLKKKKEKSTYFIQSGYGD